MMKMYQPIKIRVLSALVITLPTSISCALIITSGALLYSVLRRIV